MSEFHTAIPWLVVGAGTGWSGEIGRELSRHQRCTPFHCRKQQAMRWPSKCSEQRFGTLGGWIELKTHRQEDKRESFEVYYRSIAWYLIEEPIVDPGYLEGIQVVVSC